MRALLRRLWPLLFSGMLFMTTSQADAPRPASPMEGPDFVMEKVDAWAEHPGGDSVLVLADGSRWRLDPRRGDYEAQRAFIVRAVEKGGALLVSGSRARGTIDRVATARPLAAQRVGAQAEGGRVSVLFAGPPSIYYLRMDRPDAARSLDLLRRSAAGNPMPNTPDLLVGIDTVVSEIVLVRPLVATAAPAQR
jgi:hypothetical protein